jgi:hypothetical protein
LWMVGSVARAKPERRENKNRIPGSKTFASFYI